MVTNKSSFKTAASYLDAEPGEVLRQIDGFFDRSVFKKNSLIIWKDKNSVYQRYNHNAALFCPRQPPSLSGFTDYQITSKELADFYVADDIGCLEGKKSFSFEGPIVHKTLGIFHAQGTSFPLIDENGDAQGLFLVSHLQAKLKDMPFSGAIQVIQKGLVHCFVRQVTHLKFNNLDISLSLKESEILLYLIAGKSAKDIAQYTNSSHRTVEQHLENARTKLGCSHKSETVDRLIELDFISRF